MSSVIYKPGQGYWTRLMSAVGWGVVVAFASLWVWNQFASIAVPEEAVYYQGIGASAILLIGGVVLYYLIYIRRRSSEFLIATDGEMRKVNWSTRREIIGSTWVVIAISVIIAAILWATDIVFGLFFTWIGVLKAI